MFEALVQARPEGAAFAEQAVRTLSQRLSRNDFLTGLHRNIEWRVKSEIAIYAKIQTLHEGKSGSSVVNDFVGIRILASHPGCLAEIEEEIAKWTKQFGLLQVEREDKFEHPDESGYRAIHLDYHFLPPQDWKLPSIAGVELQLTTRLQHLHGEISHHLYHKATSPPEERVLLFLNDLSARLHEIDQEIMRFFRQRIEDRLKSQKPKCRN